MMSGALQKTFKALQVMPERGAGGVIYFTKIEDLEKRESGDFVKNCFYVAYYYIRILQIFCALSLSMSMSEYAPVQQDRLFAPFGQIGGSGDGQIGGSGYDEEIFNILRSRELIKPSDRVNKYQFKKYRNLFFYSEDSRIELNIELNTIVANTRVTSKNNISLYDIYYNDRLIKKDDILITNSSRMDDEIYNKLYKLYQDTRLKPVRPPIPEHMKKPGEKSGDTFARFAFINDTYIKKLSGHQSIPYAVARAFQLIDSAQITPVSNVGNFTSKNIVENVPFIVANKAISLQDVLGLSALEKLFYDDIYSMGGPDPQIEPRNKDEYYGFLKKMECIYEASSLADDHKPYMATKERAISRGIVMFRIRNNISKENQSIVIDRKDKRLGAVMKIQQQLFGLQLAHTRKTMEFVQKNLVEITGNGIFLNPKIQRGGFQYINWLGEQSRKILTEYYVAAESLYMTGVNAILGKQETPLIEKCRGL